MASTCVNGHEVPDGRAFCPNCGQDVSHGSTSGATTPQIVSGATRSGGWQASGRDAGIFLCVGAVLVALGLFFPWAVIHLGTITYSRNAWQLGANGAANSDPFFILLGAGLMVVAALVQFGVIRLRRTRYRYPIAPCLLAAFAILRSWLASWQLLPGATVSRGVGGWISLLGVACGVVASIFAMQASRRAASPGHPPIVSQ